MNAVRAAEPDRRSAMQGDDEQILDAIGRWLARDVRPHVRALEQALPRQQRSVEGARVQGRRA